MQLAQLNFERAFSFNQLIFIAPVILAIVYFASRKLKKTHQTILIAVLAFALMVTFWAWRWFNPPSWL